MLNPIGTLTLETSRLVLRPFIQEDALDALQYWASDPLVQPMYGEPVYQTEDEVRGLIESYIKAYEKEMTYRWAIILKQTGRCIGQIAYFLVDQKNHFSEIEYCLAREFQKRGLMTEAAKAIITFGFEKIHFHKVQISHKSTNLPSQRVIEKCGFKYEGTLRDYFYIDGEYIDRLYYSILEEEWKQQHKK